MYHPLIAVEKSLDTTLAAQVCSPCQEAYEFVIVYLYAT